MNSRMSMDPADRPLEPGQGSASRRILLIEDDEDSATSLGELLEFSGHQVTLAGNGRRGIELTALWRPEVVLCDIGLPDMDGYRVAREIRASRLPCRLLALTGYARPEDALLAREAGFDAHLTKPVEPEVVLEAVEAPAGG